MLYARINRSNPEKVFIVVYNSWPSASLTNGQTVEWDLADANGVSVTKPGINTISHGFSLAGVVAETILSGSYGLIQVYGYHSAIRARVVVSTGEDAGSADIVAGTPLTQSLTAAFCLDGMDLSATNNLMPMAFALAANANTTTAAIAGFIKAM